MFGRQMTNNSLTTKDAQMPEEMIDWVKDEVSKILLKQSKEVEMAKELKELLEGRFGGEWNVIIGERDLTTYFSKNIQNYLEI
jgi:hypothetical protein